MIVTIILQVYTIREAQFPLCYSFPTARFWNLHHHFDFTAICSSPTPAILQQGRR